MDIVYRHIEFVTWILSIVTSLLSIVTLLLSIVASMLSHVHHRIARPLGPPYDSQSFANEISRIKVFQKASWPQKPQKLHPSKITSLKNFLHIQYYFDTIHKYTLIKQSF